MKKPLFFCVLFFALQATNALACACGCGISNVATSSILPNGEGGIAFLQYDYLAQTRNWHHNHKANGHNHDLRIETQTITAGAQYMFNREFGAAIRVPYVARQLITEPHHGPILNETHNDIGDIRINGIYAGFFDDMSTGLIFGLKLPTGETKDANFGRNTQIGTGSLDSILGIYTRNSFGRSNAGYFGQITWQHPLASSGGFKTGYEVSSALGTYYKIKEVAGLNSVTPILQLTHTQKSRDSGYNDPSHNFNSGYEFLYFNPGLEVAVADFSLYFDVGLPIYRYVNGNQLVPQNIYKVILSKRF